MWKMSVLLLLLPCVHGMVRVVPRAAAPYVLRTAQARCTPPQMLRQCYDVIVIGVGGTGLEPMAFNSTRSWTGRFFDMIPPTR